MARKPWGELSPAYRKRLERGGVGPGTKDRSAARGHAKTPERPERAIKNPGKYREYLEESKSLVDRVIAHKELIWGDVHKFKGKGGYRTRGSIESVINPKTKPKPGYPKGKSIKLNRAKARKFLKMTQSDLDGLENWWDDDDWCFLFYH